MEKKEASDHSSKPTVSPSSRGIESNQLPAFHQKYECDLKSSPNEETAATLQVVRSVIREQPRYLSCHFDGCNRRALYGLIEDNAISCGDHMTESMRLVISLRCEMKNCRKSPYYGVQGELPLYCHSHRESGMIDIVNKQCSSQGCNRKAIFGIAGQRPEWCALHKVQGTVDTSYRRCEAIGCNKWPLYAYEGDRARFCSVHKRSGMNDVRSRRCKFDGCMHQPSYGIEGERAQFCRAHKHQDMVDVVSRRCVFANCRRRPLYGFAGGKPEYCSSHKMEEMIDVMNRRCKVRGCKQKPNNAEGKFLRLCATHIDTGRESVAFPTLPQLPTISSDQQSSQQIVDVSSNHLSGGGGYEQLASIAGAISNFFEHPAHSHSSYCNVQPQVHYLQPLILANTPQGDRSSSIDGLPLAIRGNFAFKSTALHQPTSDKLSGDSAHNALSIDDQNGSQGRGEQSQTYEKVFAPLRTFPVYLSSSEDLATVRFSSGVGEVLAENSKKRSAADFYSKVLSSGRKSLREEKVFSAYEPGELPKTEASDNENIYFHPEALLWDGDQLGVYKPAVTIRDRQLSVRRRVLPQPTAPYPYSGNPLSPSQLVRRDDFCNIQAQANIGRFYSTSNIDHASAVSDTTTPQIRHIYAQRRWPAIPSLNDIGSEAEPMRGNDSSMQSLDRLRMQYPRPTYSDQQVDERSEEISSSRAK